MENPITLRVESDTSSGKSARLAFTSVAHFINDGGVFTVPLIIAILASENVVSPLTIVLMPVSFYSASLILSIVVATIADRTEKPGLMVGLGLGLLSAGLLGFAISMSYARGTLLSISILFSSFVTGVGTGFYHPIGAAILQSVYKEKSKGKALGINGAMGSLGRALYPSLFFVIASAVTEDGSIAVLGLIAATASIIVSFGLRRANRLSPSEPRTAEVSRALRSRITIPLVTLTLIAFLSTFATQGVAVWIPTFLSQQKGLGISSALGRALTGLYAASIVGQPLFGYLVDRFEKRIVLAVSIVGSALSILGYLYTSGNLEAIMLALLGLFTFSSFPLFLSLVSDFVPSGASSLSNALVWSFGVNGGSIVGPAVVGALALSGYVSWFSAFELMAVAAFLTAALIGLLRRPLKGSNSGSLH